MTTPLFWAGSNESYALVAQAEARVAELMAKPGMTAGWLDDMLAKLPPMWRMQGSTAVVDINGPLVKGDAGLMRLFGVVGYDNLAKAAIEAATHPDTAKMLYHINTPGGDVAGVIDAGDLLAQLSSIKPSAVHTSEMLASAGYWLASSVKGPISAGPTAVVGSIGVLRTHTETSAMMEKLGIKTTVIRSGEHKAELNSVEPLTPEAKGRAETQLAHVHGLFRAQVAKGRPNLTGEQLAAATQGDTYIGKLAQGAGLVDKVQSFDLALKLLDKQKLSSNTPSNSKGKPMAITLSHEQLAQLTAGMSLEDLGLKADGTPMSAEELKARDDARAASELEAKLAKEAEEKRLAEEEAKAKAATDNTAIAAELSAAKADLAAANAKVTELQALAQHHDGLLAIARGATANMLIPLGGSKATVDAMDAAAVIGEHARVQPLFQAKFQPGQHSRSNASDKVSAKNEIDPFFLARVHVNKS